MKNPPFCLSAASRPRFSPAAALYLAGGRLLPALATVTQQHSSRADGKVYTPTVNEVHLTVSPSVILCCRVIEPELSVAMTVIL